MPKSVDTIEVILPDGSVAITPSQIGLIATSTAQAPTSTITWHKDVISGALVGIIYDYQTTDGSNMVIAAQDSTGAGSASVAMNDSRALNKASVTAAAGQPLTPFASKFVTIIDSSGASSFLQIGANKRSMAGRTTTTFPGASPQTVATPDIVHNWGVQANVVACCNGPGGGLTFGVVSVNVNTATLFNLFARDIGGTPAAGTTITIDYIAWET